MTEQTVSPSVDFSTGRLCVLGESRNVTDSGKLEITFATKGLKMDDLNIQPSSILRYEIEHYFDGRCIHTMAPQEQILIFTLTVLENSVSDTEVLLQRVKKGLHECLARTNEAMRVMHELHF